jgi:hypothetical protein
VNADTSKVVNAAGHPISIHIVTIPATHSRQS